MASFSTTAVLTHELLCHRIRHFFCSEGHNYR